MHLKESPNSLFLALGGVFDRATLFKGSRVDPQVGQFSDVRVRHDFEGQSGKRSRVVHITGQLVVLARLRSHRWRDVKGRRKKINDGVEHRLDALVFKSRTAENRDNGIRQGPCSQSSFQVSGGDLFIAKVLLHHVVIEVRDHINEVLASLFGFKDQVLGDWDFFEFLTHSLFPHQRTVSNEVNDTKEISFGANGELDHGGNTVEAINNHFDTSSKVRTRSVHLVDETDPRYFVLVRLAPHRLGLWLDACNGVKDCNGTVEDSQ